MGDNLDFLEMTKGPRRKKKIAYDPLPNDSANMSHQQSRQDTGAKEEEESKHGSEKTPGAKQVDVQ